MPNCVITLDGNSVKFSFNDEASKVASPEVWVRKEELDNVMVTQDDVSRINTNARPYLFSAVPTGVAVLVDSVLGEVPADNADLAEKLIALVG